MRFFSLLTQKQIVIALVSALSIGFFTYYIFTNLRNSEAEQPVDSESNPLTSLFKKKDNKTTPTPTAKTQQKTFFYSTPTPTTSTTSSSSGSSSGSSSTTSSSTSATATPTPNPCSSLSNSSYDTVILEDSPVAYYPLKVSGNACDYSTNKFNGTLTGSITSGTLPNGENAFVFDGATGYVTVADRDALSPSTTGKFTLEAWMRPDTLEFENEEGSGYVHWMGKGQTGQHEYLARMYSYTNSESRPNRISGYSFNLSGGLGVGSYFQDALTVGQWLHYVFVINTVDTSGTYPSGYSKIYKNGSQRDQDSLATLNIVPENGSAPFRIGTRDMNSFFKGAIGKVAIYNYELTPFQVLEHYQEMIPPVEGTAQFVQNVGKVSTKTTGTTMQINVTNTVPVGDTLIIRVLQDYSGGAPTITDSKGNTYTRDRTAPNSGNTIRASIFSSPITTELTSADTITITTANVTARGAVADHFTGLVTSSLVDQQNGTSGSSTTPGTSISINTTHANALIIGFVGVEGPLDDTFSEDLLGQFESLAREGIDEGTADTNITINGGYKSVSTTGTYSYRPTLDPSRNWIDFVVSYKAL